MGINLLNSVFCMTIFSRVKMGTPVAVLLGHFSVGPSAAQPKEEDDAPICATTEHEEAIPKSEVINDEEPVDNISVHEQKDQIVEKYITALKNVFSLIREVEPLQINLWKRTICQLIYSSTFLIKTPELSNEKENETWKKLNGSTGFFTNEHFDAKLSDLLYQFELIFNEEFNSILLDLAKYRALFQPQMKYSPSFNELLVKITKDDEFCFVVGLQNLIANDPLEVIESVKISDDY